MHPDMVDAMVKEVSDKLHARLQELEDKLAQSAQDHVSAMVYIAHLESILQREGLL